MTRAGIGALDHELALVAGHRRGGLELKARIVEAAEPVEQVAVERRRHARRNHTATSGRAYKFTLVACSETADDLAGWLQD